MFRLVFVLLALSLAAANAAFTHTTSTAPAAAQLKQQCGYKTFGTSTASQVFFLPSHGSSPVLPSFTPSSGTWSTIPVDPKTPVMTALNMPAFTAATNEKGDEFLVVAGGMTDSGKPTSAISMYDMASKNWTVIPDGLNPRTYDSCGVGCGDVAVFVTGVAESLAEKPANRQITRVNLTDHSIEANNMKKERAGAGCACQGGRTFWAGGSTTEGKKITTDTVEVWGATPLHRGGEPVWKLSKARSGLIGVACGPFVAFAGGAVDGQLTATVDVFNATDNSADGIHWHFNLPTPVWDAQAVCVTSGDSQFMVFAGGFTDGSGHSCSTAVSSLDVSNSGANFPAKDATLTALPALSSPMSVMGGGAGNAAVFFNGVDADVYTL